jgi:hypothetical protein
VVPVVGKNIIVSDGRSRLTHGDRVRSSRRTTVRGSAMETKRTHRDTWTIPQMCCVCGEPARDGKPYKASFVLSKTYAATGMNSTRVTTTTATMSFPRCARCVEATSVHSKAMGTGAAVGLVLGIAAIGVIGERTDSGCWLCASGLIVWVVVALALGKGLERLFGHSFDEDMWRRAKLSSSPVTITKATENAFAPELKFVFANDGYGEMFSALNP